MRVLMLSIAATFCCGAYADEGNLYTEYQAAMATPKGKIPVNVPFRVALPISKAQRDMNKAIDQAFKKTDKASCTNTQRQDTIVSVGGMTICDGAAVSANNIVIITRTNGKPIPGFGERGGSGQRGRAEAGDADDSNRIEDDDDTRGGRGQRGGTGARGGTRSRVGG